jgi:hypothetical protein
VPASDKPDLQKKIAELEGKQLVSRWPYCQTLYAWYLKKMFYFSWICCERDHCYSYCLQSTEWH